MITPSSALRPILSIMLSLRLLPSRSCRGQVDAIIFRCLRRNGLAKESEIFNLGIRTVHAASISTSFAALSVAPDVFHEALDNCKNRGEVMVGANTATETSLANLTKLRNLITATYWCPNLSVDGAKSMTYFNSSGGRAHLRRLGVLCEDYVTNLNSICKQVHEAQEELDKPNVHRVLELYKHSIPAMGHVRHFAELMFETAHQPLKRATQRSNFQDSHIQISQICIVDDWKRILQCVFDSYSGVTDAESEWNGEMELLKLICGRKPDFINSIWSDKTLREQLTTTLRSKQLLALLNSNPAKLIENECFSTWTPSKPYSIPEDDEELMALFAVARELADNFLVHEEGRNMKVFGKASRVRITASYGRTCSLPPRRHDILHRGAVILAHVQDEHSPCFRTTHGEDEEQYIVCYYAVEVLLSFCEAKEVHHGPPLKRRN